LRLHSLFSRRPSPALVIASLALFVSLGGVGYAAVTIPNNSVGSSQLKNSAVTNSKLHALSVGFGKIQFGAVGTRRINNNQVQIRVGGKCTGNNAISVIDNMGKVTCTPTTPKELGNASTAATVTSSTQVQSESLPAGSSYMLFANPQVNVAAGSGGAGTLQVSCTLATTPGDASTTQTRTVDFSNAARAQAATISLQLPVPAAANGSTATVNCTKTASGGSSNPTTTVASSLNALQTASNS
jgi:hypothetical protein